METYNLEDLTLVDQDTMDFIMEEFLDKEYGVKDLDTFTSGFVTDVADPTPASIPKSQTSELEITPGTSDPDDMDVSLPCVAFGNVSYAPEPLVEPMAASNETKPVKRGRGRPKKEKTEKPVTRKKRCAKYETDKEREFYKKESNRKCQRAKRQRMKKVEEEAKRELAEQERRNTELKAKLEQLNKDLHDMVNGAFAQNVFRAHLSWCPNSEQCHTCFFAQKYVR